MILNKIEFVERLTKDFEHSDTTFFNHLFGTYSLLKKMGEPEYICDAGLYHSIYGTSYYKANINISREIVVGIIGDDAEKLAYSFCTLPDRTDFLLYQNIEPKQFHIDLLKIEYANLVEQNLRPHDFSSSILEVRNKLIELEYENRINN